MYKTNTTLANFNLPDSAQHKKVHYLITVKLNQMFCEHS